MSSFVFGFIRSLSTALSEEEQCELCKTLIEDGIKNGIFFQFGWSISQPDVRRMIEEEIGNIDLTHMMPFLLLSRPFDDTSDALFQDTPIIEASDDFTGIRPLLRRIVNSFSHSNILKDGDLLLFFSYGYVIPSDFVRVESRFRDIVPMMFSVIDGNYTLPSTILHVRLGNK